MMAYLFFSLSGGLMSIYAAAYLACSQRYVSVYLSFYLYYNLINPVYHLVNAACICCQC